MSRHTVDSKAAATQTTNDVNILQQVSKPLTEGLNYHCCKTQLFHLFYFLVEQLQLEVGGVAQR